jgi:hypothetical protein
MVVLGAAHFCDVHIKKLNLVSQFIPFSTFINNRIVQNYGDIKLCDLQICGALGNIIFLNICYLYCKLLQPIVRKGRRATPHWSFK